MLSIEKCEELQKFGFSNNSTCLIGYEPPDKNTKIRYIELTARLRESETLPCPSLEEIWALLPEYIHKESYNHDDNESWILTMRNDYFGYFSNSNEDTAAPYQINDIFILIELDEKRKTKKDYSVLDAAADLWLLLKKQGLI